MSSSSSSGAVIVHSGPDLHGPFWRLIKPQDVVAIVWLLLTLPFCFIDLAVLWGVLLTRIILVPALFVVRPYTTRVGDAVRTDERAGHVVTHGRRAWWWFLWAASTILPWLLYPIGYQEMGKFIAVVWPNVGCSNDYGVQKFEEEVFGGQPSVTWRGRSHGAGYLLFDEYLQFAYFGLYAIVAGVPFFFWYIGRTRTLALNAAQAQAHPHDQAAAAPGGALAAQDDSASSTPSSPQLDLEASSSSSAPASSSSSPSTEVVVAGGSSDDQDLDADSPYNETTWAGRYRAKWERAPYYVFDVLICGLLLVSMFCWIIYFIHPVSGPLWCFYRPDSADTGYFFSYVNAIVQDSGAAHGTATPSSHCASTVSFWGLVFIFHKRMFIAMAFIVPGLVWATFWLQYHYLIDAIAGTMIGSFFPFIVLAYHDWCAAWLVGPGRVPLHDSPRRGGVKGIVAARKHDDPLLVDDSRYDYPDL